MPNIRSQQYSPRLSIDNTAYIFNPNMRNAKSKAIYFLKANSINYNISIPNKNSSNNI